MRLFAISKVICATILASPAVAKTCLSLPGDLNWPKDADWQSLNRTVDGKLVATDPIGSPCHDPTYNATACDELKAAWANPLTQ